MSQSPQQPVVHLYALRLTACGALAGCLEHVLTGRTRAFDSGDALLALLADGPTTDSAQRGTTPFPHS